MFRKLAAAVVVLAMTMQAKATDPVQLYAAGSLRAALTEIAAAFEAQTGIKVQAKFGPSGTLKDEIAGGAPVPVRLLPGIRAVSCAHVGFRSQR